MSDKSIDDALGIASEDENLPVIVEQEKLPAEKYDEDDFQFAKTTLYDVANTTKEMVDELVSLAKQSQSPRDFEVLNGMLKTLADTSKDIVDIETKRRKENERNDQTGRGQNVTNNNLFVGSTKELQKMLKQMKADEKNGNT